MNQLKNTNLSTNYPAQTTMTDRDKQRLDELEVKTAYLLARQDQQSAQMHQIMARLAYIEARQHRLMKELGIEPDKLHTSSTVQDDAKEINLTAVDLWRLN